MPPLSPPNQPPFHEAQCRNQPGPAGTGSGRCADEERVEFRGALPANTRESAPVLGWDAKGTRRPAKVNWRGLVARDPVATVPTSDASPRRQQKYDYDTSSSVGDPF